jgi:hypothetical protein
MFYVLYPFVIYLLTLFHNMRENKSLNTVLVYRESNVMSEEDGGCKQDDALLCAPSWFLIVFSDFRILHSCKHIVCLDVLVACESECWNIVEGI